MYVLFLCLELLSDMNGFRIQLLTARLQSSNVLCRQSSLWPSKSMVIQLGNKPNQNGTCKSTSNMFITLFNLFSRLKKAYQNHATCLIQTGCGLHPETDADDENAYHEYSDCYIPATGPNGSTTERAKNIWGASKPFSHKVLEI